MVDKNPSKSKYKLLIKRREKIGIEPLKNLNAFNDYSQTIDDDQTKKRKVSMVFNDMITHMIANKRLSPVVCELFSITIIFHCA